MNTPQRPLRRDALWLGLALLAVLAWELAGADRALSAWAGGGDVDLGRVARGPPRRAPPAPPPGGGGPVGAPRHAGARAQSDDR